MTANPQYTDQLLLPLTTSDTLKPSTCRAACEMARFYGLWVTVVLLGAVGLAGGVRMLYLADMDCTPRQVSSDGLKALAPMFEVPAADNNSLPAALHGDMNPQLVTAGAYSHRQQPR
jgi:hypothetical protein